MITLEITDTTVEVNPRVTVIQVQASIPAATGYLERTLEITALKQVTALPGTPEPTTLYFITP